MTDSLHLHISAIDTLMFRDGRPFNQGDAGASQAVSVFPPFPPTIVGAVRAALWRKLGKWDKGKLGDGTNWQSVNSVLGPLEFGATLLLKGKKPVFPIPLHLVRAKNKKWTRLSPGEMRQSDLVNARFPQPDENLAGLKTVDDQWITATGMQKTLNGGLPDKDDLFDSNDLWTNEPRVGIGVDRKTRVTKDAQLYMATHTRMLDDVSLMVSLKGFGESFERTMQPLAGEHRMAEIIPVIGETELPIMTANVENGRYCVILISPLVIDQMPKAAESFDNLPGTVVSACLGKPLVIGGWNSEHHAPIPLRQCIPTGSVWFMQGEEGLKATDIIPRSIGKATEWGFGQILIGKW